MTSRVLIATFSFSPHGARTSINGMIEPLLSFFLPKVSEVDLIDASHPGSSSVLTTYEYYRKGKKVQSIHSLISMFLAPFLNLLNTNSTQIVFKIRDLLSVFEIQIRKRRRYDLFIGLESIYTVAGIILKKLRCVNTVIYYVSDYSPNRYRNRLFNELYLALDRFCCYHADAVWDVSPAMLPARIKYGLDKRRLKPVIHVPNALFPEQICFQNNSKIKKNQLVFAGTLGSVNGPEIAIDAMTRVTATIPDAVLHFFGGGDALEEILKKRVRKQKLEKHVIFHGFITNATTLSQLINTYTVGLAPYAATPGSPRWYADATKIRLYLGAGLPVIATQVPPLAKEIEREGACIICRDNTEDFAKGIIRILSNKSLYLSMREKAIAYAKRNTWENVYTQAFKQMEISFRNH